MEKRQRTVYSREFKTAAVELSNQRGALSSVADELNITRDTLKRWKKDFNMGERKLTSGPKTRSKEEEELIRLKKELYETKLERDILKKAVSIFSKSDR
jgi:transposase